MLEMRANSSLKIFIDFGPSSDILTTMNTVTISAEEYAALLKDKARIDALHDITCAFDYYDSGEYHFYHIPQSDTPIREMLDRVALG